MQWSISYQNVCSNELIAEKPSPVAHVKYFGHKPDFASCKNGPKIGHQNKPSYGIA